MKPCERYEELISRLVDEELNREEYDALIAHIGECSRCNALYAAFNAMSELMHEEPAPLPEGLHENIMAGVRRSAIEKKNRRMRVVWTRTALTAAACLALVLFASRGFAPDEKAESVALRSAEAAEEIVPAAPMNEAALPDEVQAEAAAPMETEPENTPAPTPVPVLEGNPAPLPSPSATPVAASGAQSPSVTASPTPSAAAKPAATAAAAAPAPIPSAETETEKTPASTPVPALAGDPAPLPSPSAQPVEAAKDPAPAAPESPAVSAPAENAGTESRTEPAEAQAEADTAAAASDAAPLEEASAAPAAEADQEVKQPAEVSTGKKGLRSLFKMPALAGKSDAEESAVEESVEAAEPSPSEEPSPTPAPTPAPTAEADFMDTTPRRFSLEIRRDADFDGLLALLALEPAELPGETVSRIYEIRYIPEKDAAAAEDLQVLVIGDEVYCLRKAADGSEKSWRAGCSSDGFRAQIWQFDSSGEEAGTGENTLLSTLLGLNTAVGAAPEASPKPEASPAAQVPQPESIS